MKWFFSAPCPALAVLTLVLCAMSLSEAACPRNRRVYSNCAYTTCTPESCAARGLECCPKPCGGSWCVEGAGGLPRFRRATFRCPTFVPPPDGCESHRNNLTCLQLNCKSKASTCCHGPCGNPFCLKL
ncbi:uncharacterized protein LOC144094844 [Amblyomma americanum]